MFLIFGAMKTVSDKGSSANFASRFANFSESINFYSPGINLKVSLNCILSDDLMM